MEKVIYYFSGTGNSLNVARIIAREMGGAELISVRQDAEKVPASDAKVIGFVCPVYEWDIPERMKYFVKRLAVNKEAYFFMAATYIAVHGRCFETIDRLLRKKERGSTTGKPSAAWQASVLPMSLFLRRSS